MGTRNFKMLAPGVTDLLRLTSVINGLEQYFRTYEAMANSLLELSSGSNSHLGGLLSIIKPSLNCSVVCSQRGVQFPERAVADDLAKVTFSFPRPSCGPAQDHRTALPAPYSTRHLTHPAEQVFDEVGRGQGSVGQMAEIVEAIYQGVLQLIDAPLIAPHAAFN